MSTITPPFPQSAPSRVVDDGPEYEYFWSRGETDVRIPRWLAEIIDVPGMVRLEIFMFGVCVGLFVAAAAILVGLYIAAT